MSAWFLKMNLRDIQKKGQGPVCRTEEQTSVAESVSYSLNVHSPWISTETEATALAEHRVMRREALSSASLAVRDRHMSMFQSTGCQWEW